MSVQTKMVVSYANVGRKIGIGEPKQTTLPTCQRLPELMALIVFVITNGRTSFSIFCRISNGIRTGELESP